jgi:hypothetical protein
MLQSFRREHQYPHSLDESTIAAESAPPGETSSIGELFVGQPGSMTPLGTKGIGELAIAGMAAAIANAVYHATGTRIRSLPISIEKVLGHESERRSRDVDHHDRQQHDGANAVTPSR